MCQAVVDSEAHEVVARTLKQMFDHCGEIEVFADGSGFIGVVISLFTVELSVFFEHLKVMQLESYTSVEKPR